MYIVPMYRFDTSAPRRVACGGEAKGGGGMSSAQLYDTIGATYTVTRRTERQDPVAGLREMRRVARRVVAFTYDASDPDRFWLNRDYLPEFAGLWAGRPSLTELARAIGARTEPVLVPWDCKDGFYHAFWRRPEAYLDERVRRGMSVWARVGPDAEQRAVRSLRDDLASGRWAERNRDLLDLDAAELGDRLLIAGTSDFA
jgi:hypothetical protein